MNKVKTLLTLLFSALGIFGANEYYKPRNVKDLLKWRGVKLASGNIVWRSMFFENQKELSDLGVDSENSLWSWCNERFKQKNLSDESELSITKKFCSDSAKSIIGRIIREGEEIKLIKKEDETGFSINYLLAENPEEVARLISFPIEGTRKPQPNEVWRYLSEWCEKQKRVKIISTEELGVFGNFKKRCYNRGVKNVSELLIKQGRKPMLGWEKYKARFEDGKFEYAEQLINEIKPLLDSKKENFKSLFKTKEYEQWRGMNDGDLNDEFLLKKYGWMLYKSWCEENLKKPLLESGMYPHVYKKVSFRCTEDNPN